MYISDDFFVISTQFIRLLRRRPEPNPACPFGISVTYQDNSTVSMAYNDEKERDAMFWKLQNHLTTAKPAVQPEISSSYLLEYFKENERK